MFAVFAILLMTTFHTFACAEFECFTSKDVSTKVTPLHQVAMTHLITMSDQELDEDWKLNDFFGIIKVINPRSNPTKLEGIAQELESIGVFDFEVFAAIEGGSLERALQTKCEGCKPEEAGRYMTHYRLLKQVKQQFEQAILDYYKAEVKNDAPTLEIAKADLQRYRSVLILKDNIGFNTAQEGLGRLLREALNDIPENWDIIYFYTKPYQPIEVITSLVHRINKSYFDVAYAVNYRMYGPLVHYLKRIEDPTVPEVRHIDHQISHIHKDFNVYAIQVPLVYLKKD